MNDANRLRTRVFASAAAPKQWKWRAPIIERRRAALVEVRGVRTYETEVSARAAGERHVKRLFPGIELE